jgi:TetR/AcrR family transcriptional regulator, transcriptional repressor for nem operon
MTRAHLKLERTVMPQRPPNARGCMGVGAICEFGSVDSQLVTLRHKSGGMLHQALIERMRDAQAAGEIGKTVDIEHAARFAQMMMLGLQVAARAGESAQTLRDVAAFAIGKLRDY